MRVDGILDLVAVLNLAEIPYVIHNSSRNLQQPVLPDYTSPPTEAALAATPPEYRDDAVIDAARAADAAGNCTSLAVEACQILFPPPPGAQQSGTAKHGVLFYGGALVDPRAYSPVAKTLSDRYGFAVSIPIFAKDVAYSPSCDSGRLALAAAAFPDIEQWVLAGHSLGGVAASIDLWAALSNNETDNISGIAFMASYISQDLGCGLIDFSDTEIPTASVSASLDLIVDQEDLVNASVLLPANYTFSMDILGGNHAQFGSYDNSEREAILNQVDGQAIIPEEVQQDLTVGAIAHVASRSELPLPSWNRQEECPSGALSTRNAMGIFATGIATVFLFV